MILSAVEIRSFKENDSDEELRSEDARVERTVGRSGRRSSITMKEMDAGSLKNNYGNKNAQTSTYEASSAPG